MNRIVSPQRTPISRQQIADTLYEVYRNLFHEPLPAKHASLLWSQVCLENGNGEKFYCYNWGNITAFAGWTGEVYTFTTPERIKKKEVDGYDEWKPLALCYRVLHGHAEGCAEYLRRLSTDWPSAWEVMKSGDPHATAYALSKGKYYTAEPKGYAETLSQLAPVFFRTHLPNVRGSVRPITTDELAASVESMQRDAFEETLRQERDEAEKEDP